MIANPNDQAQASVLEAIHRVWGFSSLRPLQEQAIQAGMERRDSLVVMPTGGGKSLCYQVPPLLANRTDVVVSPLISLMKDQVDGLREVGYPAAAIYTGLSAAHRAEIERDLAAGRYRVVFAAPERLFSTPFLGLLRSAQVHSFAIDEAHCISHWGHDFRPEYRKLATLRQFFPDAAFHAYTATATQRVRDDIVAQLQLKAPVVLVGIFDRPNLVYRVVPRDDPYAQTLEVIRRHADEAVIVYCISRKDTEAMASYLKGQRIRAEHYHAGMNPEDRRRTQDAFIEEKSDVIVATVAFGMGIDRSDVRCVIHAAMPKSIEHYQQESGRAGRDGLPAECVMLYSPGDAVRWKSLMERSCEGNEHAEQILAAQFALLEHVRRFASGPVCRHKALSEYFGQAYAPTDCAACDRCMGEIEGLDDSTVIAQKILSCVARVQERYGVGHVADVLRGESSERIVSLGHDRLSTFGLLKTTEKKELIRLTYQLVDLDLLTRTDDEYPILKLNAESWKVLRGERPVHLQRGRRQKGKASRVVEQSWEGVDSGLFQSLRTLRREIAAERAVPPFVIFADTTLRELARRRPGSLDALRDCFGVGQKKLADLGQRFLDHLQNYCVQNALDLDAKPPENPPPPSRSHRARPKQNVVELFARGAGIEEAMNALGRARSTVVGYLADYITDHAPPDVSRWIDPMLYERIAAAASQVGAERLKPIHDHLEGQVPYDDIRLTLAHLTATSRSSRETHRPDV